MRILAVVGMATLFSILALKVALAAELPSLLEVRLEITGCQEPLVRGSVCKVHFWWSGDSGGLREAAVLRFLRSEKGRGGMVPSPDDFRESRSLTPSQEELEKAGSEGIFRVLKVSDFPSWIFEGPKAWVHCAKVRVKDRADRVAEAKAVCLNGRA